MKLLWVKSGSEMLIGEGPSLSSALGQGGILKNPMVIQVVNIPQPPRIAGSAPQSVRGFNLLPFPCSEISLERVDYAGVIKEKDPVYITYYATRKAIEEQEQSELLVNQ